ncbi:hypothetical protein [Streptomyces aureocirculatus]|uniref:hypothetical protein n=1 Tax=Streptomyces aureocirculatus TaxID=67275 RepID=UPI0004C49291|nr:hypothetical protein [Streptomyces aureocirculatus]
MTTVDAPLPHLSPADSTERPVHLVEIRRPDDEYPAAAPTGMCGGCQFHSATVNACPPNGSYPIEATTLTDTAEFQDFSWGHGYEREMPLDTPAKEVADVVLATLPVQGKQSVLVS